MLPEQQMNAPQRIPAPSDFFLFTGVYKLGPNDEPVRRENSARMAS